MFVKEGRHIQKNLEGDLAHLLSIMFKSDRLAKLLPKPKSGVGMGRDEILIFVITS